MRQAEPYLLWLGHAGSARDVAGIHTAGIQAVVQLAIEEPPAIFPRELLSFRIPLNDGSGNSAPCLRLAVELVASLMASRIPTLVCCGAGMSRSPSITACAIARLENRDPIACLESLSGRAKTDVSPILWHELLAALAD
jgi:hypothetical protein